MVSTKTSTYKNRQGLTLNLILGVLSIVLFIGIVEILLYFYDFNYSRTPIMMRDEEISAYIDWQERNIPAMHFAPHKTRFWTAKPGIGIVNERGFLGRLIPIEKDPNLMRVLFLGDSCTTSGIGSHSEYMIEALKKRYDIDAEPLIAAVGGYSTFQGMLYFKEAKKYDPDVIVAYFGWNDHWFASGGLPDNEYKSPSRLNIFLVETLGRLRTYQLIHYLIYPPKIMKEGLLVKDLLRVPPKYFVSNIEEMIALASEKGLNIFFIDPPLGPHIVDIQRDYLFKPSKDIPGLHAEYSQLLREMVKRHTNAHLVTFDDIVFDKSIMREDGIHPNAQGYKIIGNKTAERIMEERMESDRRK